MIWIVGVCRSSVQREASGGLYAPGRLRAGAALNHHPSNSNGRSTSTPRLLLSPLRNAAAVAPAELPLPSAAAPETLASLKSFTDSRDLNPGRALHARLVRTLRLDVAQGNALINLYAKCGRTGIARQLFDGLPVRNVVSYSALMAGYLHAGLPSEALHVFRRMECGPSPVRPNEFAFATALACCSDLKALWEGEQYHARVLRSGLGPFPYVQNGLLHMYLTCSGVEDASRFFFYSTEAAGCDVYSCNTMINGFLENGRLGEAARVLGYILRDVNLWDHVTYLAALGLSAGSKDLRLGSQLHGQVLTRGVQVNIFVGNCVVDMYGKCGDISGARCAFRELRLRNVVSWTAIMAACSQNGLFEEALNLYLEMDADGIRPNEYTYAIMFNSCASLSALRQGDALNAHADKSGFRQHLVVQNALISMYARSGSIWEARRVFDAMLRRDIVSWNSMISGYSHHGLGREALEVFHHMLMEGVVVPTPVTFVGVLSACGHSGLVDDGFYYLNHMMREMGMLPTVEHYTCIVGLLCRVGRLEEANRFMRTTDTQWDAVAWRTLLSACQVRKKYGLGKQVAEHILEFDPDDVGTYVLLSNMYAKTKRWDGVAKIRKLMRGRDIKKEPGISWIQLQNQTHVFVSGDKKHPQMNQIYAKLKDLLAQIRLMGYVPDIDNVLHDVEDEHKEECVSYHSEKLAVAFGIVAMPWAAPIHVIKNLRICDDCHTAIKLISFVAARKILVRDANRFHCFENAKCSCGDYW